ncbi:MAG: hypothetical protein JSR60_15965 [Proteobacteria bacterium]|nr:hypothetical protein [Pseudomonadota bacterium]
MGRALLLAAVVAGGLAGSSLASDKSPFEGKTAGAFVAYCKEHFDELNAMQGPCADWIGWQDVMISTVERPRTACYGYRSVDDQKQHYLAVFDWLRNHTELAATPSDKAITSAFRALYPCP